MRVHKSPRLMSQTPKVPLGAKNIAEGLHQSAYKKRADEETPKPKKKKKKRRHNNFGKFLK